MSKKPIKNDVNDTDKNTKSPNKYFTRWLLFLLTLLALIIFLQLSTDINNEDKEGGITPIDLESSEELEDSDDKEVYYISPVENNFSHGAEPPIITDALTNHSKEETKELEEEIQSKNYSSSTLSDYRVYLANATKLLSKIEKNKEYKEELSIFNQLQHPQRVKSILNEIEELIIALDELNSNTTNEINPFNYEFLSKMIKIKRVKNKGVAYQMIQDKINDNIKLLWDYVYSEQLQNNFIK